MNDSSIKTLQNFKEFNWKAAAMILPTIAAVALAAFWALIQTHFDERYVMKESVAEMKQDIREIKNFLMHKVDK